MPHNVRIRRRPKQPPPTPADAKPYRVTIHAAGDQHHTYAMGPGDGLGVGTIRIDIDSDGGIHASPLEPEVDESLDTTPFEMPKFEKLKGVGGRTY